MLRQMFGIAGLVMLQLAGSSAEAARVSDVRNTKHNLSALPYNAGGGVVDNRTIKATTEQQLCVFCHTPHAAENIPNAPIWNRKLSAVTYTTYSSTSLDATDLGQPSDRSSKLCLTCHDGTQALGAVNVLNAAETDKNPATEDIAMSGTAAGKMTDGSGASTGYTRNLGVDLSNDHPISFTYNTALAQADGDLSDPALVTHVRNPSPGVRPELPLNNNKVECATCHDPHVRDSTGTDIKFLRLNRFQANTNPTGIAFNKANDIICLGCHYKRGWSNSAHANPAVADEIYKDAAADERGFPRGIKVWEAACLNCHDPHTVQGSKRLLRDGTDSVLTPKSGGNPALEETCLRCHSDNGNTLNTQGWGTPVPDIRSDLDSLYKMPIRSANSSAGVEVHNIGTANAGAPDHRGEDNIESPELLGKGNPMNRHAECTDCHHNHRMIRNRYITSDPTTPDAGGTHNHDQDTTGRHTNKASGVLRGSWGVEPVYGGSNAFGTNPTSFLVKRGVPPVGDTLLDDATDAPTKSYMSREYQICLKCHSNYAYDTPPLLSSFAGGTPSALNGSGQGAASGMTRYTNQAMEFYAPISHAGEIGKNLGVDGGADLDFNTENHRSWHPVMRPTGRTKAQRKLTSMVAFLSPWANVTGQPEDVGYQTMFCSDCHGRKSQPKSGWPLDPLLTGKNENGRAWGAHGSEFKFILKGTWDDQTGDSSSADDLCFKCHNYRVYSTSQYGGSGYSGFSSSGEGNLHEFHRSKTNSGSLRCSWCHVAVPHGWKNKSLLVNLNDVNPAETERHPTADDYVVAGVPKQVAFPNPGSVAGTSYEIVLKNWKGSNQNPYKNVYVGYYNPPYYNGAAMKFKSFASSGTWTANDCGSKNNKDNESDSVDWMRNTCRNLP